MVLVDVDGVLVSCCYMVLLLLMWLYILLIMVKCMFGGVMLNWLYVNVKFGVELSVFGLFGIFMLLLGLVVKVFYLFVGLGVMLLMLMMRVVIDFGLNCDIVFVYSVRMFVDIVFCDEFECLSVEVDCFKVIYICEVMGFELDWCGLIGWFSFELL